MQELDEWCLSGPNPKRVKGKKMFNHPIKESEAWGRKMTRPRKVELLCPILSQQGTLRITPVIRRGDQGRGNVTCRKRGGDSWVLKGGGALITTVGCRH